MYAVWIANYSYLFFKVYLFMLPKKAPISAFVAVLLKKISIATCVASIWAGFSNINQFKKQLLELCSLYWMFREYTFISFCLESSYGTFREVGTDLCFLINRSINK